MLCLDTTNTNWVRDVIPEKATSVIAVVMRLQKIKNDVVKHEQRKAFLT